MTLSAPDNSDDIIPELTWRTYILPMIKMTQIGLFPPIFNDVIDVRAEIHLLLNNEHIACEPINTPGMKHQIISPFLK